MTMPLAGEFWLAEIPFTRGTAAKLRPVLVLWEDAADIVVAAVTKAAPRSLISELILRNFQEFAILQGGLVGHNAGDGHIERPGDVYQRRPIQENGGDELIHQVAM